MRGSTQQVLWVGTVCDQCAGKGMGDLLCSPRSFLCMAIAFV